MQGLASDAVKAAYGALKTLIINRFKRVTLEKIEEAPTSASTRDALAGSLKETGADQDPDIKQLAQKLAEALEEMGYEKLRSANIEIGVVEGYRNAIVEDIEASGKIAIRRMTASTGDAIVSRVRAGVQPQKKA